MLLDDFEPGMKTAEVRAVFDELKAELVPLIAEIGLVEGDDAFMSGPWPIDAQHAYSLEIIKRFGFDESFARLDLTVHPFAASSGTQDIRLTTRYKEDDITSIFTAMHECGHGLYEHGSRPRSSARRSATVFPPPCTSRRADGRTSSAAAASSGTTSTRRCRSGSRRRSATSTRSASTARSTASPSHVRVDADEATYNLHIILRFELEQEIFAGTIGLADLPAEWNRRFEEYLGIPVPTDTLGVLQALVGRGLRLLPHLLARQHRLGADLGEVARSCPTCRSSSSRASSGSCTSGCRPACTRSAGSSPRRRRSSGWSAHRGSTRRPTCAT